MFDHPQLKITAVVSQPFAENTYIAHLPEESDCVVFDPGLEPGKILSYLDQHRLVPAAILLTHGHSDHIGGNAALKDRWPECPLVIGAGDAPMLTDPELNLSAPFGFPIISPPADQLLQEGETVSFAGIELAVLDIPGHSPGHVVYVWSAGTPAIVFGGDVLFQGSIGRTDFPGGSFETLAEGIHGKLFTQSDSTVVLPGHGPPTTVGEEKRHNPFVGAPAGYRA